MQCEVMMGRGKKGYARKRPLRQCSNEATVDFRYDSGCVRHYCAAHARIERASQEWNLARAREAKIEEMVRQFRKLSIVQMERVLEAAQ